MPQDQMTIVRLSVKNIDAAEQGRGNLKWRKRLEDFREEVKTF